VKGSAVTAARSFGARPAARRMSNALGALVTLLMLPLSNALDAAGRDRRHRVSERGAPPGRTPHRNARGPVVPALSILGGAKMSTQ
jgi:hypothetical protein